MHHLSIIGTAVSLVFSGIGLLEKVLYSRYLSAETASGENRQEEVCTALVNLPDILCNEIYILKVKKPLNKLKQPI
jgi:hypothetical protein